MKWLSLLLLVCVAAPLWAADLNWDDRVTRGQLDNGLKYYIQENAEPEARMELRLVINAGSVLEDDDQRGLAHFAEHMAFNGTKNFKKLELVNYLESIGMSFGADLNAYTSFDETVYMLQLPLDDPEIVRKGFLILGDWAQGVLFEDEDIVDERGVVLEERRSRRGAQQRIRDAHFEKVFYGSKYAERMPIGTLDVLENFEHDRLRAFYRDWYRPDLMAVVAVGDFKTEAVKQLIEAHFSGLNNPENARPREEFPLPDHSDTFVSAVTDKEATMSSITVYYKHPATYMRTSKDYRTGIIESMFTGMLNKRLAEIRKKPDAPFLQGFSYKGGFVRNKSFFGLGAMVKEGEYLRGLEALLTEVERVKQFGFTESEFSREKSDVLSGLERAFNERDTTASRAYATRFVQAFLKNNVEIGIKERLALYRAQIEGIQLSEINALAQTWVSKNSRVITLDGPDKADSALPVEEQVLAVFEAVSNKEVEGYVDEGANKPLIRRTPEPGKVTGRSTEEKLDVTTLTLSNGIKVMAKVTDFKEDQILMSTWSLGGDSLIPESHYLSSSLAAAVVQECGIGEFSSVQLSKKLAGKQVSVSPYINENTEGMNGSSTPGDLETLFQLMHLYFTAPRQDPDAFLSLQQRMKESLRNRLANPQAVFSDVVQETMSQGHPRRRTWTPEMIEEVSLLRSVVAYKDRFRDANDFTFLFVGNIDMKQLESLCAKYLASLPVDEGEEKFIDRNVRSPKGVINKSVHKGQEPKSVVSRMYTGDFDFNYANRYQVQSMIGVLKIKLREKLREELGGTYGVSVYPAMSHYPVQRYTIHIGFGCAPDQVETLLDAVDEVIDALKTEPAAQVDVDKVKESQVRSREIALRTNSFWLSTLQFYHVNGEDPLTVFDLEKYVEKLMPQDIQRSAVRYLGTPNVATFVLYPEGKGKGER